MAVKDFSIGRARLSAVGVLALLGVAVCGQGCAEDPPREAFDACLNRASGSACVVQTPRDEIAGRCATEPYGLACIPMDPGHQPGEEGGAEFSRR
jgi:hypothetical protein